MSARSARCNAETKRGRICRRPATVWDARRGEMVCARHAPRLDQGFLKLGSLVVNANQIVYVDVNAEGTGWVDVVIAGGPGGESLSRRFPPDSDEAQAILRWVEEGDWRKPGT